MALNFNMKENLEELKKGAKNFFSLRNLIVSLISALLVIGASYLSSVAGTFVQQKALASQIIFTVYLLVVIVLFFLSIAAPAFLSAVNSKDWPSFVYIIVLEIIWLSIFIAVLYFTLPTPKVPSLDMMTQ